MLSFLNINEINSPEHKIPPFSQLLNSLITATEQTENRLFQGCAIVVIISASIYLFSFKYYHTVHLFFYSVLSASNVQNISDITASPNTHQSCNLNGVVLIVHIKIL